MYRIESKIDPKSPDFTENRARMTALVDEFKERLARAREGGPEHQRERHHKRGKLLVRERLEKLFDPNTPFLELSLALYREIGDEEAARAALAAAAGSTRNPFTLIASANLAIEVRQRWFRSSRMAEIRVPASCSNCRGSRTCSITSAQSTMS